MSEQRIAAGVAARRGGRRKAARDSRHEDVAAGAPVVSDPRTVEGFFRSRHSPWLALPVGAAMSFGFAPFGWWPLGVLCLAYLFLAWAQATPRQAAKVGFLFTAATFLAGTYWLYHSIYAIGKAPLWVTLIAILTIAVVMGAYSAIIGYVLTRWIVPGAHAQPISRSAGLRPAFALLLAFPAAWTIHEWFRGWFLSGFPWLAVGYTHLDTPIAGLAPLGGVYTMSLAVAVCAGAVALLALRVPGGRVPAAIAILMPWLLGFALWGHEWTQPVRKPVSVAIVQGAVPQEMKWDQAQFEATLDLYSNLTRPHLGTQIIVWPESALAAPQYLLGDYLQREWLQARDSGSSLVLGQLRHESARDVYFNAVLALGDEPQWYAKRHLVPLSEYFPIPAFLQDWLRGMELPYSGFEAGARSQPALDAAGEKLGASICYEDAYASDQLGVLKEATLLVNVTNDAWFGDSTAAHQHLQISRTRALEAGRSLLRAANDGISAIIGSDGKVVKTLPRFQPGVLTGNVQPRTGLTPYARVGNWPVILLSVGALVFCAFRSRRKT
jgi:apolipoprotein N-acyltransferase